MIGGGQRTWRPRGTEKDLALSGGYVEVVRKEFGDLAGWPACVRLKLADRFHRAPNTVCELLARQILCFAALFQVATEGNLAIHPVPVFVPAIVPEELFRTRRQRGVIRSCN